jgi:hypothetical protein
LQGNPHATEEILQRALQKTWQSARWLNGLGILQGRQLSLAENVTAERLAAIEERMDEPRGLPACALVVSFGGRSDTGMPSEWGATSSIGRGLEPTGPSIRHGSVWRQC